MKAGSRVQTEVGFGEVIGKEESTGKLIVKLDVIPAGPYNPIAMIQKAHGGIFVKESELRVI